MIVLFTGFVPEPENQIKGGWLFVSIFFMQIIWNLFFAFSDMARVAMLSILKVYKFVKFKLTRKQRESVELAESSSSSILEEVQT